MKLSTKCRYGTRAMLEISRNHEKGVATKRKDITADQGIPPSYLENILIDLRDHGLLTTVRGPKGGFSLTRPPEKISVFDVVSALRDNDMAPVDCLMPGCDCERKPGCITRQVWQAMQQAQEKVLKKYNLKALIHSDGSGVENLEYVI